MGPDERDAIYVGEKRINIFYKIKNGIHVIDTSRKRQHKAGKNDAIFRYLIG